MKPSDEIQRMIVAESLRVVMMTLRTCRQEIRDKEDHRHWSRCYRPATLIVDVEPRRSYFSCDACRYLHPEDWIEAPHARAIRRWNRAVAAKSAIDIGLEAIDIASMLVNALPPCPLPLGSAPCPLCLWANGMEEDHAYRGRASMVTLTRELAKLRPIFGGLVERYDEIDRIGTGLVALSLATASERPGEVV